MPKAFTHSGATRSDVRMSSTTTGRRVFTAPISAGIACTPSFPIALKRSHSAGST